MGADAPDMHGWPDHAIGRIAARQQSIITRAQLLTLGVSPSAIGRALERGRVHRVHRGVYSLMALGARPPQADERAALLACGEWAVLSHESAARRHQLRLPPTAPGRRTVHVTVPGAHRRRHHGGVRVHQTRSLGRADWHRLGGWPVTSIPRTVVDLSAGYDDRGLQRLVDDALSRVSITKLRAVAEALAGRPGAGRVLWLLEGEQPSSATWSEAEERLLALIRRAGLPVPEVNVRLGDYIPDLLWREQRVIVEFDSWQYHGGRAPFEHDRARHNDLTADGYQVIHVTWRQLSAAPEQVLAWIAVALARG